MAEGDQMMEEDSSDLMMVALVVTAVALLLIILVGVAFCVLQRKRSNKLAKVEYLEGGRAPKE